MDCTVETFLSDLSKAPYNMVTFPDKISSREALQTLASNDILSAPVISSDGAEQCTGVVDVFSILREPFSSSFRLPSGQNVAERICRALNETRVAEVTRRDVDCMPAARLKSERLLDLIKDHFLRQQAGATPSTNVPQRVLVIDDSAAAAEGQQVKGPRPVISISMFDIVKFIQKHPRILGVQMWAPLSELGFGVESVKSVPSTQPTIEVLREMIAQEVPSVCVVHFETGELISAFSLTDLGRLDMEHWELLELPILRFLDKTNMRFFSAPLTVHKTDSFGHAVHLMTENRTHRVWIVDDNKVPSGVVTSHDVCCAAYLLGTTAEGSVRIPFQELFRPTQLHAQAQNFYPSNQRKLQEFTLQQVLDTLGKWPPVRDVVSCTLNDRLDDALFTMAQNHILSVPVVRNDASCTFVGIVDMAAIVRRLVREVEVEGEGAALETQQQMDHFRGLELSEVSSVDFALAWPVKLNDSFLSVLKAFTGTRRLSKHHKGVVHRLVVLNEEGGVASIFSQSDALKFTAQHADIMGSKVQATLRDLGLVDGNVISIGKLSPVWEGFRKMAHEHISGVAVVDEVTGELVDTLSYSDLRCLKPEDMRALQMPVNEFKKHTQHWEGNAGTLPVSAPADAPLHFVVKELTANRIHRVFIVDQYQKPIGVVTLADVLCLLANE